MLFWIDHVYPTIPRNLFLQFRITLFIHVYILNKFSQTDRPTKKVLDYLSAGRVHTKYEPQASNWAQKKITRPHFSRPKLHLKRKSQKQLVISLTIHENIFDRLTLHWQYFEKSRTVILYLLKILIQKIFFNLIFLTCTWTVSILLFNLNVVLKVSFNISFIGFLSFPSFHLFC